MATTERDIKAGNVSKHNLHSAYLTDRVFLLGGLKGQGRGGTLSLTVFFWTWQEAPFELCGTVLVREQRVGKPAGHNHV